LKNNNLIRFNSGKNKYPKFLLEPVKEFISETAQFIKEIENGKTGYIGIITV